MGGDSPFTLTHFATGFGGLLSVTLGLPVDMPPWAGFVLTSAILGVAIRGRLISSLTLILAAASLVAMPAAILVLRPGNIEFPRYFLVCGLTLNVVLAEMAGRLWTRGGAQRYVGIALVMAVCTGQVPRVADLLRYGRGEPGAAVALMAADGPTSVWGPRAVRFVVRAEALRLGLDVRLPDTVDGCAQPAMWLISSTGDEQSIPDKPDIDPMCHARFEKIKTIPTAPWSGVSWTLFRRLP